MVNQKSVKNKAVLLSWLIGIDNCLCRCHWVTFLQNSNDLDLIKLKVLRVLETLKNKLRFCNNEHKLKSFPG